MLDLVKNNQNLRLMRKRGRRDELDTFVIEDIKDEIVDFDNLALLTQSRKSVEFPIVKKWTSPRLRSVSCNRMNKSDEIDTTGNKSISPTSRVKHKLLNVYGEIEGVKIGDWWSSRLECADIGVHRTAFANIHAGPDGAYSVALTGCYEYTDKGTNFVYSGSACRDLRGSKDTKKKSNIAAQSKNPVVGCYNASLIKNFETGNPVRVIRGYKLNSKFAPLRGYRYDGLYSVDKFWTCKGASGLVIFKFLMIRCENQLPALWELDFNHSKNHSPKQSPSVKSAAEDSVNQHQAMSSHSEPVADESIKSNGYADDNKENSTVNIADKLLSYDSFADGGLLSADDDSLPRLTKRKLPRRSKAKQNSKKPRDRSAENVEERSAGASAEAGEPSDSFRGFSPQFYPRKMILLGFLIHDMQSKLSADQTV